LVPLCGLVLSTIIAPALALTLKSPVGAMPSLCFSKSSQNFVVTPSHVLPETTDAPEEPPFPALDPALPPEPALPPPLAELPAVERPPPPPLCPGEPALPTPPVAGDAPPFAMEPPIAAAPALAPLGAAPPLGLAPAPPLGSPVLGPELEEQLAAARPSATIQGESSKAPRRAKERRIRNVPIVRMDFYWPRQRRLVDK
jgi:hypothetical protein